MGLQTNDLGGNTTAYVFLLVTSNRTYQLFRGNAGSIRLGSSFFGCSGSVVADMDASDTAYVTIQVNNGAPSLVVDIPAGQTINYFNGKKLA